VARYRAGIETESRIVDATRHLLGEVGLEGTTLKAICDRAGVRAGSFYNLFPSKDEVVLRVVGEAITAVDPDPEGLHIDTVADLVEAYIAFITGESSLARIYLQIAVSGAIAHDELGQRVLRHHTHRVERFADAMRRADAALDDAAAKERAEVLTATLNGLAFRLVLDETFDFACHARLAASSPVAG
jgi:AcrR family transcriptional regulator